MRRDIYIAVEPLGMPPSRHNQTECEGTQEKSVRVVPGGEGPVAEGKEKSAIDQKSKLLEDDGTGGSKGRL